MTWPVSPRDRMILDGVEYEVVGSPERHDQSPFGPMSAFPLLFTVGHRSYTGGGDDGYGDPVDSWSDPVERRVHGWSTPRTSEPKLAGHDRDVVDVELLVPDCRVVNLRAVNG